MNRKYMKKIATLFSLLFVAILASAQPKQTYLSDFKKGQTATYEFFFTESFQRNSDGTMVEGVELHSWYNFNYMTELTQYISSGDTISNKFSLTMIEATPYAYIMDMKIIDIGLPKSIIGHNDSKDFLEIIDILKGLNFRLMFSKQMSNWKAINTTEIYKNFITEARKSGKSFMQDELTKSDEELIADMQEGKMFNTFTQIFLPGLNTFTSAYRIRYNEGHHEEGELKENEVSFHYVSDAKKGKGKEFTFNGNVTSMSSKYDTYQSYDKAESDTIADDSVDTVAVIDYKPKLCKEQNLIEVKMNKDSWLEVYENKTITNYPSGIGTIYEVIRRRNN